MIRIVKGSSPAILVKKARVWRDRLLELIATNQPIPKSLASAYCRPDIKHAIQAETHGKCAYCESKIAHIDFGHIEHITPKSRQPEGWFDWDNLTLACSVCNVRKADYWEPDAPIINPYRDDPSEHLFASGPLLFPRPGRPMGRRTRDLLGLNRPELVERRAERLERLLDLAEQWAAAPAGTWKDFRRLALEEETANDREYAFTVRAFVSLATSHTILGSAPAKAKNHEGI